MDGRESEFNCWSEPCCLSTMTYPWKIGLLPISGVSHLSEWLPALSLLQKCLNFLGDLREEHSGLMKWYGRIVLCMSNVKYQLSRQELERRPVERQYYCHTLSRKPGRREMVKLIWKKDKNVSLKKKKKGLSLVRLGSLGKEMFGLS